VLGLLVVAVPAVPTLADYVYVKPYEVSEAFDPQEGYSYLKDRVTTDDVVVFNVLSPAGHYERFRDGEDPPWTYVLRWDPVIEPLDPAIESRIVPETAQHRRLWAALYKGTVGANLDLKRWLDTHLFPSHGEWLSDTLYLQYLSPRGPTVTVKPDIRFEQGISLRSAEYTARTEPNGPVTLQLQWIAERPVDHSYKVFAHLYALDGRLVAQHDTIPANGLVPTLNWEPAAPVIDRHGLWVPQGPAQPLRLVVGLYAPDSGIRLVNEGGVDHTELGMVEVVPTEG
jgi:hypothetical protein